MEQTPKLDWHRVRTIFEEALMRPREERRSYAKELSGGDESVCAEVNSLLDSHEASESFLETPAVAQVVETARADENQLAAGRRLLHYEIREMIGAGGMGEVYLARDTRLGRNVAIKLLRQDHLPHFRSGDRLLREARASALLEHPNICQVHEISEVDGLSFIVMQYVVGTTLDELLSGRGVDAATALDIAIQVAEGLAEAHRQGVIHRDIKPANIMVSDKGQVKILDFGLAKFLEAESSVDAANRLESTGGVMGTVPYMSPEQLLGNPVDARTDVFSFGSMLFEMLCGVPAFRRKNNEETIAAILRSEPDWSLLSPSLSSVVQRCLAKDPSGRYASALDVAQALVETRKHIPKKSWTKPRKTDGQRFDAETYQDIGAVTIPNIVEYATPRSQPQPHESWIKPRRIRLLSLLALFLVASSFGSYVLYQKSASGQDATVKPTASIATESALPYTEGPARRLSPFGNSLIVIPGGTFTMGRDDGPENERPAHKETVRTFLMDRTEVTNGEYYQFVVETGYKLIPSHWVNGVPISGEEQMPVRFVNKDDIDAFIKWRTNRDGMRYRLPTEAEWEFAARNGSKENNYPWGDNFEARCAWTGQYSTTPIAVGTHSCPNVWGVHDLIGNVWEWTSSSRSHGERASYAIRGGSALSPHNSKTVTSMSRAFVEGGRKDKELGFRLVNDNLANPRR